MMKCLGDVSLQITRASRRRQAPAKFWGVLRKSLSRIGHELFLPRSTLKQPAELRCAIPPGRPPVKEAGQEAGYEECANRGARGRRKGQRRRTRRPRGRPPRSARI